MTKAESIFWTFFKGSEQEKADWRIVNMAFLHTEMDADHNADNTDSEFRVADPADRSHLWVIDDMPSHVRVKSDGEADVKWFDGAAQQYCRQNLANPVSVSYNRFGKVKRKTWLNEDATVTERDFDA